MREAEWVEHTIEPVFDEHSRVLVLGTMPSPKSREAGFCYGHPQNRFWQVLSLVLDAPLPTTIEAKKEMLLQKHIALWDVLAGCSIRGASDASIRDAKPNDLSRILSRAPIEAIFATGKTAAALYEKHCQTKTGMPIITLPSTSPANRGRHTLESLVQAYEQIGAVLK